MGDDRLILDGDAEATTDLESEIADFMSDEVEVEVEDASETPEVEVEGDGDKEDLPSEVSTEESPVEGSESVGGEVEEEVVPPSDEVSQLKAQIESLTGLVSQLAAQKEGEQKKGEPSLNLDALMEGMDFDEIMESKEAFTKFLKAALENVVATTSTSIQDMVPEAVTRQVSMAEVRENFYTANPELNAVRPYVATVASGVAAENPEWGVKEVLEEAASRARTALNLPTASAPSVKKDKGPAPTLPGAKQVRKDAPKVSALQQEIDELLD